MNTNVAPASLLCAATKATIQLTQKMAAAGADAVLVVTPCFYKQKMNSPALVQHFTKVGQAQPHICVPHLCDMQQLQ